MLLPLQIITGALMWGVQQWPQAAAWSGGLPFLAPFHSLVAWLFASFIVAHVYLTTTGRDGLRGHPGHGDRLGKGRSPRRHEPADRRAQAEDDRTCDPTWQPVMCAGLAVTSESEP